MAITHERVPTLIVHVRLYFGKYIIKHINLLFGTISSGNLQNALDQRVRDNYAFKICSQIVPPLELRYSWI